MNKPRKKRQRRTCARKLIAKLRSAKAYHRFTWLDLEIAAGVPEGTINSAIGSWKCTPEKQQQLRDGLKKLIGSTAPDEKQPAEEAAKDRLAYVKNLEDRLTTSEAEAARWREEARRLKQGPSVEMLENIIGTVENLRKSHDPETVYLAVRLLEAGVAC